MGYGRFFLQNGLANFGRKVPRIWRKFCSTSNYIHLNIASVRHSVSPTVLQSVSPLVRQPVSPSVRQSVSPSVRQSVSHRNLQSYSKPSPGSGLVISWVAMSAFKANIFTLRLNYGEDIDCGFYLSILFSVSKSLFPFISDPTLLSLLKTTNIKNKKTNPLFRLFFLLCIR